MTKAQTRCSDLLGSAVFSPPACDIVIHHFEFESNNKSLRFKNGSE